jgi:hypothetical protein
MDKNAKTAKKSEMEVSGAAPETDPLARYRRYAEVLTGTGTAIPKLLAERVSLRQELGSAEISGNNIQGTKERLAAIHAALESAGRQRAAAVESLLGMGDELRQSRASAAQELAGIAQTALASFQMRWAKACSDLGCLVAEAETLGAALRCAVATPPPYVATLSADGMSMQVAYSGHAELVPPPLLPPEVLGVTHTLDEIDSALALIAGVGQAYELTERHRALCQQRRTPSRMGGLFLVVKEFNYLGTQFTPGMLLDRTVLPDGVLYRFQLGRDLRAVEDAATVAA